MTKNPALPHLSHELARIHSYTSLMARLANEGSTATFEVQQLQTIFADIASVTGQAYAQLEAVDNPTYVDNFEK